MSDAVLAIENLSVALPSWADRPHAVDDVSLEVLRKEILCVVGKSGSGKSVMAKAILRLLPEPHVRVTGGRVMYEGQDLPDAAAHRHPCRARRPHRHDLPGADGGAQPADDGRPADRRDHRGAHQRCDRQNGANAWSRCSATCACPSPSAFSPATRTSCRAVSASA